MIARLLALLLLLASPAVAQDVARVVYLGIEGDPYYEPQPLYTGLSLRDRRRRSKGFGWDIGTHAFWAAPLV